MQSFQILVNEFYGKEVDIRDVIFEKFFHLFFRVDRIKTMELTFPVKNSSTSKSLHDWFKDGKIPTDDVFSYFFTKKNNETLTQKYILNEQNYELFKQYYSKISQYDPDVHKNNYHVNRQFLSFILPNGLLDKFEKINNFKNFFTDFEEVKEYTFSSDQELFKQADRFEKFFRDVKQIIIESKFLFMPLPINSRKIFEGIMPMKLISTITNKSITLGKSEDISAYEINGRYVLHVCSYYDRSDGKLISPDTKIFKYCGMLDCEFPNNLREYIGEIRVFDKREEIEKYLRS
jgi:hypothetical protein